MAQTPLERLTKSGDVHHARHLIKKATNIRDGETDKFVIVAVTVLACERTDLHCQGMQMGPARLRKQAQVIAQESEISLAKLDIVDERRPRKKAAHLGRI